ncbi:histone-like nucleoid-structuring protein Lsr2 [Agrococcus jejuensis]|uniref:histone-like nucleoid-structuring protein Lsr2 n=1 Tax=Agrococcus jejuensis TaxID=399736 RepID=UPI0011A84E01|nr:Lsr2 family protein [Agrococcus jejuensis]
MAKQTIVEIVDDISGERLADGAGRTVAFAFDGAQYEIDLTHEHADELREALEPWIAASRRVSATSRASSPRRSGSSRASKDVQAIREWAAANGHQVATRGRIPANVVEAYEAR